MIEFVVGQICECDEGEVTLEKRAGEPSQNAWWVRDARGRAFVRCGEELRPAVPRPGDTVRVLAVIQGSLALMGKDVVAESIKASPSYAGRAFVSANGESFHATVALLRRATASATEAPVWVPKEGERVTGVLVGMGSKELTGTYVGVSDEGNAAVNDDKGLDWYLLRDSLRPVESPAKRFYTSMPPASELPKVLPAGTRSEGSHDLERLVCDGELRFYVCKDGRSCCRIPAHAIEWSSVEVQTSPPSSVSNARHCDKCMNPVSFGTLCDEHIRSLGKPVEQEAKKPDPYAELVQLCPDCHVRIELNGPERCVYCNHREREARGRFAAVTSILDMTARLAPELPPRDALDRYAAMKRKRPDPVAREVESAHPSTWPSECDSEELRVT